jgi:uncharacterized membrane protein
VRLLRHREHSQAMALAAVSIISIVAMMAFAIDAATFFVIRRELQNAADAGALAGAMYFSPDAPLIPPLTGACAAKTDPTIDSTHNDAVVRVACHYTDLNTGNASRLCNTPITLLNAYTAGRVVNTYPNRAVVVEVGCQAQYSFGRILNLASRPVSAYAIAVIATWDFGVAPPTFRSSWIPFTFCPQPLGQPTCRDASRLIPE